MAKSPLEQHVEAIKQDRELVLSLKDSPPTNMVVLGDATKEYWIQKPEDLWDHETEICTVQELIECLKSERQ